MKTITLHELLDKKEIPTDLFGTLFIKTVLVEFEWARCFVAQDSSSNYYALLENNASDELFGWILTKISVDDFRMAINGIRDIQSLFKDKPSYLITFASDSAIGTVKEVKELVGKNQIKGSIYLKQKTNNATPSNKEVIEKTSKFIHKKIIEEFPFLMPRNVFSDEPAKDFDYSYTLLDTMPKGWVIAFGFVLCAELKKVLVSQKILDKYRIYEIKEKYGTLRWYANIENEEINKVLDKFIKLSEEVCIVCGKPATHTTKGYISFVCDEH